MTIKTISFTKFKLQIIITLVLITISLSAEPVLSAKSAILIDSLTGTVLYEKNSQTSIPPASMTKLMSLYVVYKKIEEGIVSKNEIIRVSKNADFRSLPPHSSLMFLEEGQEVTMHNLMLGLAVPSGNDAAIAIAERIAGSVGGFVNLMNLEAELLGLSSVHFEDASGLSAENRVTAAEFVQFCSEYINKFPEALKDLHSVHSLTYPKEVNWKANGSSVYGSITQYNRNNLLGIYAPVDGLKTGYIDESGFNIALTAKMEGNQGERRLIAVLLGGPGENSTEGSMLRAIDGINLLSYGFYNFENVQSEVPGIKSPKIWKGTNTELEIEYPEIPFITLTATQATILQTEVIIPQNIIAPIKKGEVIGEIIQYAEEETIRKYNITAAENIPKGGFFRRLLDTIKIFFLKLSGDY
ncbi:MAG: D-alanyl-D-alanine carboxypeptidase family protein [Spirochaetota bacterium]|nr:D-alanyl-D-alanine carboxypeptidase family protein [Spirochaetota bacterium]